MWSPLQQQVNIKGSLVLSESPQGDSTRTFQKRVVVVVGSREREEVRTAAVVVGVSDIIAVKQF